MQGARRDGTPFVGIRIGKGLLSTHESYGIMPWNTPIGRRNDGESV